MSSPSWDDVDGALAFRAQAGPPDSTPARRSDLVYREWGGLQRRRPMSATEQEVFSRAAADVRGALRLLRQARVEDEDVRVAEARLENWLAENEGRWTS